MVVLGQFAIWNVNGARYNYVVQVFTMGGIEGIVTCIFSTLRLNLIGDTQLTVGKELNVPKMSSQTSGIVTLLTGV